MPNFEYEDKHYAEGYTAVCGCDEAGRGPLCGPVVAAAVILPRDTVIEGLNDSKKLTEKKREALFDIIKETKGGFMEYKLGSVVIMKKEHPCKTNEFEVVRVGADIKIKCLNCGRLVMMPRVEFNKKIKKVIKL